MIVDNTIERSKVYNKLLGMYKSKFRELVEKIPSDSITSRMAQASINEDILKQSLLTNSQEFRDFAYKIANSLVVGRISCTTYAAVVAKIAEQLGVDYKAYAGFCLQTNSSNYRKNKDGWENSGAYQEMPTHVFLMIGNKFYEWYNGDTSNIDHLDAVEI